MTNLQRAVLKKKFHRVLDNTREIAGIVALGLAGAASEVALVFNLVSENPQFTDNLSAQTPVTVQATQSTLVQDCRYMGRFAFRICD